MKLANKSKLHTGIIVSFLIITAILCKYVYLLSDTLLYDKIAVFIRVFIYIGLFSAWGLSVNKRILHSRVRKILIAAAIIMIFWLAVREFKWRLVVDATALRYLWYAYYIPIMIIPLIALFISMYLSKPEDYRLPKRISSLLSLCTFALIVLVLTNDIHNLVFKFPENAAPRTEHEYSYGIGFYIIFAWTSMCGILSFIIMLTKCRIPQTKKIQYLPLIPMGAAILYVVLNCLHERYVTSVINDLAVFDCLVFTAFFESCIQCGLIQANTYYPELFNASVKCSVQITDNDYNVCFSAEKSELISKEAMKLAENGPIITENNKYLHNMPITGGHAIWTEDISALLKLREILEDRKRELEERNAWLQYEYEREKDYRIIKEQNRLYDLMQNKTQRQLDKIERLTIRYKGTDKLEEKQQILSYIVVLGSFIKRRKDFILSIDSTPTLPVKKLSSAFGESFRALKKMNISGGFYVNTEKEFVDGKILAYAYDFFEDVIETVLDAAKYINTRVCEVNGVLRINIMTDCNCETKYLCFKYPQISISAEDDGTELVMPLDGGMLQ